MVLFWVPEGGVELQEGSDGEEDDPLVVVAIVQAEVGEHHGDAGEDEGDIGEDLDFPEAPCGGVVALIALGDLGSGEEDNAYEVHPGPGGALDEDSGY